VLQGLAVVQSEAEKGALAFAWFAILGEYDRFRWWGIDTHAFGSSPNQ
jgi:hypothetical protein